MNKEAVFTVTENFLEGYLDVNSKRYPEHSKLMIPTTKLFEVMNYLSNVFNNTYNIGVVFDVE